MKEVEFNKEYYNSETNTKFEFYYTGLASEDYVESEKLENLLDQFTNNANHVDITRNVSYLRTVLKNFSENLLIVRFSCEKFSEEVLYKNNNLVFYGKKSDDQNKYEIEYDSKTGLNISCPNKENESLIDFDFYIEELKKASDTLKQLNNIQEIELTTNSKVLVEIYNLFYGENPDFTSKDINIKFQTMMSILCNFGIGTAKGYNFVNNYNNVNMPGSLELEYEVQSLYPLGVVSIDKPKLTAWAQKVVKAVGSTIRESVNNQAVLNSVLIILSKVVYAAKYDLDSNVDLNRIAVDSGRSESDINFCIKLVKRINSKIDEK